MDSKPVVELIVNNISQASRSFKKEFLELDIEGGKKPDLLFTDGSGWDNLGKNLVSIENGEYQIIAKSINNSQSADKVSISLELQSLYRVLRKSN